MVLKKSMWDLTYVTIICKKHGPFPQMPTNHLRYNKCPMCKDENGGFAKTQLMRRVAKKGKGLLYFLKVFDANEEFIKIGYTTETVKKRYDNLKTRYSYNYETIKEVIVTDGEVLFNIENDLKNEFRSSRYSPIRSFAGSITEVFNISVKDDISKYIEDFESSLSPATTIV